MKNQLTIEELDLLIAKAEQQIKDQEKLNDQKAKAAGFTHRVNVWIHPSSGDDKQLSLYYKVEPTDEVIQRWLKKNRSTVLNDYQVIKL